MRICPWEEESCADDCMAEKNILDDLDRRILRQFQSDPSAAAADLAERCNVTSATLWRRLERLRSANIILAEEAIIDWAVLGYTVGVSLRVTLDKTDPRAFDEFLAAARLVPEVLEIQTFLGSVDARLSLIARDLAHYQRLYRDRILTLPHIADIEALMHMSRVKADVTLPL